MRRIGWQPLIPFVFSKKHKEKASSFSGYNKKEEGTLVSGKKRSLDPVMQKKLITREATRADEALGVFRKMREFGCRPDTTSFNIVIQIFCEEGDMDVVLIGDFDKALELLDEIEKVENGGMPNVVSYISLIQNFCDNGRTVEALAVLDRMGSRGCFPNQVTISTLIKRFYSDDNIEEAHKLIEKVVVNGSVSRNKCYSCLVVSLLRIRT
ncbi:hypothetical protein IFM89_008369 [Coptis chinensis]|uniref:Pentatricopeptide repeat-containing protein n=1 Tax=Coptis chinensis TaxID=261450 RepID=A0A835INB1_9MAGN|nr:hypothetical protein IFM89_008369 [Coptis chinensis]